MRTFQRARPMAMAYHLLQEQRKAGLLPPEDK